MLQKKEPKSVAAVPGTNYDDEYAYDDNEEYDDEYEEDDDPKSLNNSQRAKRSIDDNTARLRNILHMRRHATFQEGSDNPPVMAKIVITGTEEETSPYHSKKEDEVRPANKNKHKNKFREDVENVNGCQQNSVLAHFGADTSAIRGQRHYEGNHRMYHPNRIFRDWTPAEWVSDFNVDSQVEFDNGYVTITDAPGIYFFYAQIFYADTHDSSGYKVLVNNHPVFQCTTTAKNKNNE
ncbi:hypothetical protein O3M35_009809 [Rhynocoris fuscipes]|uniref:Uncharacterized protein n=1 Tax=Rhynocoris fuscipes TaxID=488301 RepID=A0AAW1D4D6_9HEMI